MGNWKGEETTGDSQPAIASPGAPNPPFLVRALSGSRVKALLATVRPKGSTRLPSPLGRQRLKSALFPKSSLPSLGKDWRDGDGGRDSKGCPLVGQEVLLPCLSALPGPLKVGRQGRNGRCRG